MKTAINVREGILDKDSAFNIKRFKLGPIKVDRPIKALNINAITRTRLTKFGKAARLRGLQRDNEFSATFYEVSRILSERAVNRILEEADNGAISRMLGYKQWAGSLSVLIYTLSFNPLRSKLLKDLEDLSGLLSYYHSFSSVALFVPNIKVRKYVESKDPKTGKTKQRLEKIASLDDYIAYVDWAVEKLGSMNHLDIFVPISLKFGMRDLVALAKHYLKREYFNVWIDFESGSPSPQNIGRIRRFLEVFRENGRLNDVVIYVSNISREFESSPTLDKTAGTDPIATLCGANLVGGNRSKGIPRDSKTPALQGQFIQYKARLFDSGTYYYLRSDLVKDENLRGLLNNKEYNTIINTALIDAELGRQSEHFLKDGEIQKYVSTKQMLVEYRNGQLLKEIFQSSRRKRGSQSSDSQRDLLDFLP